MNCARCCNVLSRRKYEGIEIDQCAKCGGTWLDAGELLHIVKVEIEKFTSELIHETLVSAYSGVPENEQRAALKCPSCGTKMKAGNYDYCSGVIIDNCPGCHGVWLDRNELEKVQIIREKRRHEVEKNKDKLVKLAESAAMNESAKLEADRTRGKFFLYSILDKLLGD